MMKIAVLGLGRFGMRLAKELGNYDVEVIAIDRHIRLVNEIQDHVTAAVQMDITDEDAMKAQQIGAVDVCVVAIGEGFESAILTTLVAKNLGVKTVISRAQSETQADILRRVGADRVIQPENEIAVSLARRLANPRLEDFIELDQDHSIIQLIAPKSFIGRTLGQLRLRNRYHVNLVALKRRIKTGDTEQERVISVPTEADVIKDGDVLVLVGRHDALAALPQE